jgi:integrase
MSKVHFTKALIESIVPAVGRNLTFTDDNVRGLTLIVSPAPNGVKTFYFTRKHRGRVRRIKLGRFPECSVTIAREGAAKFHIDYDAGIDTADIKRKERAQLTLSAFFEIYHEQHCQLHNKRPRDARYHFEHYIKPELGNRQLSDIQRADVAELHRHLGISGRPRTANKAHSLLRAILNRAMRWDYFKGPNPAQFVDRFKETSRERFLQPTELQEFHKALRQEPEIIQDLIYFLLFSGARKMEALTMRWSDVDLAAGSWHISESKNGKPRTVALSGNPALVILQRRSANPLASRWVFPGADPTRHYVDPKRAWERIRDNSGLHDLRIHDLRRTLGSWMLGNGSNLVTIKDALGHKDIKSTLVYARNNIDVVRKEMASAARKLMPKPYRVPGGSK